MRPLEARIRFESIAFGWDADEDTTAYCQGYLWALRRRDNLSGPKRDQQISEMLRERHQARFAAPDTWGTVWTAELEGRLSGLSYGDEPIIGEDALWLL